MPITRNFTLYLNAGISVAPTVHVNQYDRGEQWVFTLLDDKGQKYTPSSGALIGVKADGNAIAGVTGTVGSNGDVYITETQQMTAAAGKAIFELTIDGQTHGTANFIVQVEKKPTDDAVLSESDLSIIQQGIDSVTPAAINETVSEYLAEHMTNPPIDPTLTVSNAAADAKVTGDKITDLKNALNVTDKQLDSLEQFVRKTVVHDFSVTKPVANRSYGQATKIIDVDIPSGQEYTIKISTTATRGGNIAIYEVHSDSTDRSLTYNASVDTDLSYTAAKDTTSFQIMVTSGGFTSSGEISFTAKYSESTNNSIESRVDAIEDDTEDIHDELDDIYIDYVTLKGENLIPYWENGNIDDDGYPETDPGRIRTPQINVSDNKQYWMVSVSENAEGTVVVSNWTNQTYGIIHCYNGTTHLGVITVGNQGLFTPIQNTTKIAISNALAAMTYIHLYEYSNGQYPSEHDDIIEKTFDTNTIKYIPIEKDQLGFLKRSSVCYYDKNSLGPWYIYGNIIRSSIVPLDEGCYLYQIVCNGLDGVYVEFYNSDKSFISEESYGNYQTPIKFVTPDNTKYIQIFIGKRNIVLSDITSINIYGITGDTIGFDTPSKVIGVDNIPELPPLAFTGHAGSGILCLGHGGCSSLYAEDSIESFYAIARNGYHGTEVDVQFTKDNIPVCWHNPTLITLEGGTDNHIYDYTLAELDANFDFSSWWDTRGCFRKTIARFEEVCVLARAFGWTIYVDKMTGEQGKESVNNAVIIAMLKKYQLGNKLIINANFTGLINAFPDQPLELTSQEAIQDEAWVNSLLTNYVPDKCHTDEHGNKIVDDEYTIYACFNWFTCKRDSGVQACAEMTELLLAHNIKPLWYTIESPEDIYQLVKYCPGTAAVLTGAYTIPDGINEYFNIKWGNRKYDINSSISL